MCEMIFKCSLHFKDMVVSHYIFLTLIDKNFTHIGFPISQLHYSVIMKDTKITIVSIYSLLQY